MRTAVVGLSAYLDREAYLQVGSEVFREPYAFIREGVMRNFTPNLSNIAVVTNLAELGYQVEQVDTTLEFGLPFTAEARADWTRRLAKYFAEQSFDNIFISCVSAAEHLNLKLVSQTIKGVLPHCIIGAGSYHANTLRERLFDEIPALDFVFLGDIEASTRQLMECLSTRTLGALATLPNVLVRGDSPERFAEKRPVVKSVASHFSYRTCHKYLAYYDSLAAVGMKGCPYTCSFCQEKVVRPGFTYRETSAVVSEVADNYDYYDSIFGHREIGYGFMDPIFGLDPSWLDQFCKAVSVSRLRFYWGAQTRIGQLKATQLERMAQAGCRIVYYGLENYSEEMLSRMNKAKHPDRYLAQFELDISNCHHNNIAVETNILFGYPGETEQTLWANEKGIRQTLAAYPSSSVNLNLFRPLPGTKGLSDADFGSGSKLLIPEWWTKPVVPGITVLVQPSAEVTPQRLLTFYRTIYDHANTYKRRGVTDHLVALFAKGELTKADLLSVSSSIRQKLWQLAGSAAA